jgi:ribosomal protein S18 acetylase RimI-like enzyme
MEISRLAVVPEMQGRGVGRRLLMTCLDYARRDGASRVVLTTNSRLARALRLYEAAGFRYAAVPAAVARKYRTADVFMTLRLDG